MSTEARFAWLLSTLGAATAAVLLTRHAPPFLHPSAPVPALCVTLALLAATALVLPAPLAPRALPPLHAALACTRLALVITLELAWSGDARDLWAALAVYVALHDAERGLVPAAPLAPAALALALALAWNAPVRAVAPARAVLVTLVAAAAAAWGDSRRTRSTPPPANP